MGLGQLAVDRAVMAVDIEPFGDTGRTDADRLAVRRVLWEAMDSAFTAVGLHPSDREVEDRGDLMLIVAQPGIPKDRLASSLPNLLAESIREYNRQHGGGTAVRLRVALHQGQVHYDEHGLSGDTVNQTFRLVDSAFLRDVLRRANGPLALVVSDAFYGGVLRGAAGYERVEVSWKEGTAVAWLRVPGAPVTEVKHLREEVTVGSPASRWLAAVVEHFPGPAGLARPEETTAALTRSLLMVPSMVDDRMRELVVHELLADIGVAIPRHPRASTDVRSIVRTVMARDGGLAALLAAVERVQGDTPELDALHRQVIGILVSLEDLAPMPKPLWLEEQPVPQSPVAPPASDPAWAEPRRSRTGLWTAFVDGLSRSLAVGATPPRPRRTPPRERILARLHDRYNSLGSPDEAPEGGAVR